TPPSRPPGSTPSTPFDMSEVVMTAMSDQQLVHAARAGSRAAFEALVRRYQKPLYFLCHRYLRDHDQAAEVAQRTFIRAIESLADLRDPDFFRGWLFRIGVNIALNHLRDQARHNGQSQSPDEVAAPGLQAALESAERSRAL